MRGVTSSLRVDYACYRLFIHECNEERQAISIAFFLPECDAAFSSASLYIYNIDTPIQRVALLTEAISRREVEI